MGCKKEERKKRYQQQRGVAKIERLLLFRRLSGDRRLSRCRGGQDYKRANSTGLGRSCVVIRERANQVEAQRSSNNL